MTKIKPTLEQKKIFHYIDKRKENLLIEARAGAGKTSTLVAAVNLLPKNASITFLAFNKHIQMELKNKLPDYVYCYTSHGLGLSALKRKYGDDIVFEEFKVDNHINKKKDRWKLKDEFPNYPEQEVYLSSLKKLINLCRATLTTDKKYVPYIAEKHDIRYSEPKDVKRVLSVLEAMTNDRKTFDFTDMIYLPAIDPKIWFFPQDYVLVDEVQDMNRAQQTIIQKILKRDRVTKQQTGRLFAIGDPFQCQPIGTKIYLNGGDIKPIEELNIGDYLVSYVNKWGRYVGHSTKYNRTSGRKIEDIVKRKYCGKLITVYSNNKKSSYTPNHKCIVKFNPQKINKEKNPQILYLMERNGKYRIGICPLWYFGKYDVGLGLRARSLQETADSAWILNIYESKKDAFIDEQIYSNLFNIPQIVFKDRMNHTFLKQKNIDYIYDNIFFDKNKINLLLKKFNRDINLPFWTKGMYISKKHGFECYSTNIIGDYMEVNHFEYNNNRVNWHPIENIEYINYNDFVYSLKIEKDEKYVADGILTHNSIYGFTGADSKSFEWFKKQPNTKTLLLSHSFRCGNAIIKEAQKIVPDIYPKDNVHEGLVREGSIIDEATDGDFVLCRTTMPLVKLFFTFLLDNKKAIIKGSDIGISLVEMTKEHKSVTETQRFWDKELKEFEKGLKDKGILNFEDHSGYVSLKDKIGVLNFFGKISKTLPDMRKKIRQVFRDDVEGIMLSTIHKAKGLEANRVFIARPDLLPMNASTKWQKDQEKNLEYVAITRAKNELIYDYKWTDVDPDEEREKLKKRRNENKDIKTRRKRKD